MGLTEREQEKTKRCVSQMIKHNSQAVFNKCYRCELLT